MHILFILFLFFVFLNANCKIQIYCMVKHMTMLKFWKAAFQSVIIAFKKLFYIFIIDFIYFENI